MSILALCIELMLTLARYLKTSPENRQATKVQALDFQHGGRYTEAYGKCGSYDIKHNSSESIGQLLITTV